MIKAWDKDGNAIPIPANSLLHKEVGPQLQALGMYLAIISQNLKTIVTKVELENDAFKMVLEQK